MAGALQIKHGTKMRLAFDAPLSQEPQFHMICTFNKALDESAFLVSIPMVGGKPLSLDENQKLLFKYGEGEETCILAGYADDEVKEGIRHYWKIRRVAEQRQLVRTCGYPYESRPSGPIHAGHLGIEFRWGDRQGKGRDAGYFQWRSGCLYEPLVSGGRDLYVYSAASWYGFGRSCSP